MISLWTQTNFYMDYERPPKTRRYCRLPEKSCLVCGDCYSCAWIWSAALHDGGPSPSTHAPTCQSKATRFIYPGSEPVHVVALMLKEFVTYCIHLVLLTGGWQGGGGLRERWSFTTIRALSSELQHGQEKDNRSDQTQAIHQSVQTLRNPNNKRIQ